MKAIAKYTSLFFLLFSATICVSAQGVLWETYSGSGKRAYGRGDYIEAERLLKAALKEAENLQDNELIAKSNDFLGGLYFTAEKI